MDRFHENPAIGQGRNGQILGLNNGRLGTSVGRKSAMARFFPKSWHHCWAEKFRFLMPFNLKILLARLGAKWTEIQKFGKFGT